jgi:hypothetical protein|tara:strand:+ start:876 stop:1193 length:318 start_codon:yes stop_codon:yes gene_type:complete
MLTLNTYLKWQFEHKKIPSDLLKMCNEQHFSQSQNKWIFKGDMDICHLLRSLKKELNVYLSEQIKEEERQSRKLEKFEKWLDTCPIDYHTSRHPSSEIKTINFEL